MASTHSATPDASANATHPENRLRDFITALSSYSEGAAGLQRQSPVGGSSSSARFSHAHASSDGV